MSRQQTAKQLTGIFTTSTRELEAEGILDGNVSVLSSVCHAIHCCFVLWGEAKYAPDWLACTASRCAVLGVTPADNLCVLVAHRSNGAVSSMLFQHAHEGAEALPPVMRGEPPSWLRLVGDHLQL